MEIDITRFCTENDPCDYSASVAELGDHAGKITWKAALREAAHAPMLTTDEQLEAFRDYVAQFGAWTNDEIAAWSPTECNALFIQFVSGDLQEAGLECLTEDAWLEYDRRSQNGECSSNIYRDFDGQIYYYIGS